MPKKGQPPRGPIRPPTYADITMEIERLLSRSPRGTRARLGEAAGLDAAAFSHRMTQRKGVRFSWEQLGAIAAAANAPPYWPFVPWEEGERFAAVTALVKSRA
jgi:hypothetical protein